MSKKVGLVLQGGGANGAYQAGAIYALMVYYGVRVDFISGTSVGAINGGFIAQYLKDRQHHAADALVGFWKEVSDAKVFKKWYNGWLWFLPALWKLSLWCSKPLRKMLAKHYSEKRVKGSDVELVVGAHNIHTGERREWKNGEVTAKVIEASAAFPIALEPVWIESQLYTDDGVRETTPLEVAIKSGCDTIYVILNGPNAKVTGNLPKKPKFWHIWPRTLMGVIAETEKWDIKAAQLHNRLIKAGDNPEGYRELDIRIVEPSMALGDSLDFSPEKAITNMMRGQADAEAMGEKWGLKPNPSKSVPYVGGANA